MKRVPVTSSNIAEVGYDATTQTLEIMFNDGAIYQYFDVPQAVYEGMLASGSVGKFFHAHVKGSYRYARL